MRLIRAKEFPYPDRYEYFIDAGLRVTRSGLAKLGLEAWFPGPVLEPAPAQAMDIAPPGGPVVPSATSASAPLKWF